MRIHELRMKSFLVMLVLTVVLLVLPLTTLADNFSIEKVSATSFVPGQEGIYFVTLVSDQELDLSTGAKLVIQLPASFGLIKEDILAPNPGVTLANIQYMYPGDRFYSVITGETSVVKTAQAVQLHFTVVKGDKNPIRPNTQLVITVPGVINSTNAGSYSLQVSHTGNSGQTKMAQTTFRLGYPPALAPANLQVSAVGSYQFNASWDRVPGAEYYQLYYSLTPDGTYIQACDFSRDPGPDERWLLTETKVSFRGEGNGGILADRNYYFKVRAGNEYGFGPFSPAVAIRTPAVLINGILVTDQGTIELTCDQAVRINALNRIEVYEMATGVPVNEDAVAKGNKVVLYPDLKPGHRYQVVLYEDALESAVRPGVHNAVFVFEFTAREVI
ncbi:MAG: fibronectin type III domain-containing protein [Firmicutes bacterium]|nr:fibronectin type III domain-containing protein [Bacillota bacterium]